MCKNSYCNIFKSGENRFILCVYWVLIYGDLIWYFMLSVLFQCIVSFTISRECIFILVDSYSQSLPSCTGSIMAAYAVEDECTKPCADKRIQSLWPSGFFGCWQIGIITTNSISITRLLCQRGPRVAVAIFLLSSDSYWSPFSTCPLSRRQRIELRMAPRNTRHTNIVKGLIMSRAGAKLHVIHRPGSSHIDISLLPRDRRREHRHVQEVRNGGRWNQFDRGRCHQSCVGKGRAKTGGLLCRSNIIHIRCREGNNRICLW